MLCLRYMAYYKYIKIINIIYYMCDSITESFYENHDQWTMYPWVP